MNTRPFNWKKNLRAINIFNGYDIVADLLLTSTTLVESQPLSQRATNVSIGHGRVIWTDVFYMNYFLFIFFCGFCSMAGRGKKLARFQYIYFLFRRSISY